MRQKKKEEEEEEEEEVEEDSPAHPVVRPAQRSLQ
jgi:hypothetical protein